jgi:hypothetical protein
VVCSFLLNFDQPTHWKHSHSYSRNCLPNPVSPNRWIIRSHQPSKLFRNFYWRLRLFRQKVIFLCWPFIMSYEVCQFPTHLGLINVDLGNSCLSKGCGCNFNLQSSCLKHGTALVMCPDFMLFPFQDKNPKPDVAVVTWARITQRNIDIHDFSLSLNTIRAGPWTYSKQFYGFSTVMT